MVREVAELRALVVTSAPSAQVDKAVACTDRLRVHSGDNTALLSSSIKTLGELVGGFGGCGCGRLGVAVAGWLSEGRLWFGLGAH